MLNLLTSEQTRLADEFTIRQEPVKSIDLMERAATAFTNAFVAYYPDKATAVTVYCGTGNNGGDGLAIARLLSLQGYNVRVRVARFSGKSTKDFDGNLARLMQHQIPLNEYRQFQEIKQESSDVIVDALLGSGLNKPLAGEWLTLVEWLNSRGKPIVSVDIPSGFKAEGPVSKHDVTIKSHLTISFQRPKINFLLPESALCINKFEVVDIGLDESFIQTQITPYLLLTADYVAAHIKKRKAFSHKGTYGHALIIAGAAETMGAALLCAEASLNMGSGLTTACIPVGGVTALNIRIPEVMALLRHHDKLPGDIEWAKYNSMAIGPGLGTSAESKAILESALKNYRHPMVIDADALNLLAAYPELIALVPQLSVLTPHVKEFDRLFGDHENWWQRMETAIKKSAELQVVIVLKNRYTMIFTPVGKCVFNPTGTPAMASGGMGDVLTGIIVSLLAQGYKPEDAAILGVYIHGKTGEEIEKSGFSVTTATMLLKNIGRSFVR